MRIMSYILIIVLTTLFVSASYNDVVSKILSIIENRKNPHYKISHKLLKYQTAICFTKHHFETVAEKENLFWE